MIETLNIDKNNINETSKASLCFRQVGVEVTVPQSCLHGRQTFDEYSLRRLKSVDRALQEQGFPFLEDHPLKVIFIQSENSYPIVRSHLCVWDGHHRGRVAPKHGIRWIPALVADLAQFALYINQDPCELVELFSQQTNSAYASFWSRYRNLPSPDYLDPKIKTIEELERYFSRRYTDAVNAERPYRGTLAL